MCDPSTPFSRLELRVRPVQLGSSPQFFRYPALADSDSPAAFVGRRDSGLGLDCTVIMSNLNTRCRLQEQMSGRLSYAGGAANPGAMSPAPSLPVVRSFRVTYPKHPKAMVHTNVPRLHMPGISRGK